MRRCSVSICLISMALLLSNGPVLAQEEFRSPEMVQTFQAALALLGYETGPIDGVLGPQTTAALRFFQLDHDLDATGQPDKPTLLAIRDDLEVFDSIESLKDLGRRIAESSEVIHTSDR